MVKANPTFSSGASPSGPTVLVVEDNPIVMQTATMLLEDSGFRVVTAVDGVDGLKKFRQATPDVVLTDIIMPDKEGISLIIDIRRERPDAKIIAMSGGGRIGNSDYVTIAKALGADIGLRKPFDDLELINAVRELAGHARVGTAPPAAA